MMNIIKQTLNNKRMQVVWQN